MSDAGPAGSVTLRGLAGMPLLAGITERVLEKLAAASHLHRMHRGQVLFEQGDVAEAVYLVRSGSLAMRLLALDGRELVMNEVRAGEVFGELGLLSGGLRSTGAVALEASEIIGIPNAVFLEILEEEPRLVRRLLEVIADRLRASGERESALAFLEAPARLAHVLLDLDRRAGPSDAITASQEALAQRLGLTRQTVAKVLGQWRRAGWLLTGRGKLVLLNRSALRRQALAGGAEVSVVSGK